MLQLHAGNHIGLPARDALAHLLQPDHIAFVAITLAVGVLCYRAGRRAESRAIAVRKEDRR